MNSEKVIEYFVEKLPGVIDFALSVILALVVFAVGAKVIGWIRKLTKRSLQRSSVDTGVAQFADSVLKFGLYALLLFSIGKKFGLDTASVAAVLASGGVAIGLALQGSLSNFAGGVLILLLKPFIVGDYIVESSNGHEGVVKEIQVFYTKLATPDNRTIIIPNGTLVNNSLTNVTAQDKRRVDLAVDISYDADLKKAKEIIAALLEQEEGVLQGEDKNVFVSELGASSVILGVRVWVAKDDYWTVRWGLLEKIKMALDENGIEIPYQQIVVHTK